MISQLAVSGLKVNRLDMYGEVRTVLLFLHESCDSLLLR